MNITEIGNQAAKSAHNLNRATVGGRILQFDADFRMLRSRRYGQASSRKL